MAAQPQDPWWTETQPSRGLLQGLAIVPLSLFLKILLPLTAVFLTAFTLQYRTEVGAEQRRLLDQETSVLHRSVRQLERELEIATGDLFFLAELATEVVEDRASDRLAAFKRSVLTFVRRQPGYLRTRVIDATGQEIFRVETMPGGARIAPESELQDQTDRRYFTGTMRLEAGQLSASLTERDVEEGALDGPSESATRLATPIDDAAGQRRGVVTLTVRGGHLLRSFEQDTAESGIQRMVVSSDGDWLRPGSEVERGFALERGKSFQRSFPEVWPQLLASPRGGVETSEGFFYFETLAPSQAASNADAATEEPSVWVFVSLVPRKLLDDIAVEVATPLLVIATPLYFALLAAGCFLASALHRRRLADEALRSLEQVKGAMMIAALDGIVVMDEKGTTLEFNPAAQRIFGYTLEEARGKLVADLIIPPTYRETHRLGLEHYLATGEGRIIDKHVDELTAVRKNGEEFPVELTVCPVMVAGKQFFYGFLRDLSESGRKQVEADLQGAARLTSFGLRS